MTNLPNQSFYGKWFLPDDQENQVWGTLTYNINEGITLEVGGSFASSNFYNNIDIIFGLVESRQKITLINSNVISLSFTTKIKSSIIALGVHLDNPNEVFNSVKFSFPQFTDWLEENIIEFNKLDEKNNIEITSKLPEPRSYQKGQKNYELFYYNRYNKLKNEFHLSIDAFIRITIEQPEGFSYWRRFLYKISGFLSIIYFHPIPISKITLTYEDRNFEVLFTPLKGIDNEYDRHYGKKLISSSLVKMKILEYIDNWLNLYNDLEEILDLYCNQIRYKNLTIQQRFLNLSRVVETFHRKKGKTQNVLPRKDWKDKLNSISSQIENTEEANWIKSKLCFANEPSLQNRLCELNQDIPNYFESIFLLDLTKLAKDIVNTRNYLTHFSRDKNTKKGIDLIMTTQNLRVFVLYFILKELDFEESTIEEIMKVFKSKFWYNHKVD